MPRSGAILPIVRLPARMRSALEAFREITGLTAVTSLATFGGSKRVPVLSPPVHPRCAKRLRSVRRTAPCREQWSIHVRAGRRSPKVHTHTCPVGLRCSCVPIHFDGELVGLVKLVAGPETPEGAFSAATRLLAPIVTGTFHESLLSMLSEEVRALRRRVAEFQETQCKRAPFANGLDAPPSRPDPQAGQQEHLRLVDGALSHLHRHFRAPALSLLSVGEALGCNPRYLTTQFTLVMGERMHAYLVRLRVGHACRLLMDTDGPVKAVAYASGFRGNTGLARAFRRHVGVSPRDTVASSRLSDELACSPTAAAAPSPAVPRTS